MEPAALYRYGSVEARLEKCCWIDRSLGFCGGTGLRAIAGCVCGNPNWSPDIQVSYS